MSSQDSKIITVFQQRRQIEQAIKVLSETNSEEELIQRAAEIAQHGEVVLPALLAQLGTADPQLRGGLAHIARMLPREKVVPALRAAARDRTRSDRERMTAMTILERFLGEELGPEFFEGLADPHTLALESLREALSEIRDDPQVLVEYLTQLEQEPVEAALMIIDATRRVSPDDVVELLRMLAMDPRPRVARHALQQLGGLRISAALVALRSLLPHLPEDLKSLAERSLRKLRLSGVPESSLEASAWRALLSPIDSEGYQSLWFIRSSPEEEEGLFVSVLLHDQTGIQYALGDERLPFTQPMREQAIGTVHLLRMPQMGMIALLLEVPFDEGRRILAEGLTVHLREGRPLPMPYRFYSGHIWAIPWSPEEVPLVSPDTPAEDWPLEYSRRLLEHPAFSAWGVQRPWVYDIAEALIHEHGGWPDDEAIRDTACEIAGRAFTDEAVGLMAQRLHRMGQWLHLAGEMELAGLAIWTAAHLHDAPPASHPFLLGVAKAGLRSAMLNLKQGIDPRRPPAR